MAEQFWPFLSGAGTAVLDSQWQTFFALVMQDGVVANQLNTLAVAAGSGLQITVNTGYAFTRGVFYNNTASKAINLAAADPTNPRIDNVVVHMNRTGSVDSAGVAAYTINTIVLTGTPNVSPVAPAVTQNANTWEISLNNVRVNANAVTPSSFTDTRTYTPNWPIIYQQSGVAEVGNTGGQWVAAGAGAVWGVFTNFKRTMQVAPTSITLTAVAISNLSANSTSQFNTTGFFFTATSTAAGVLQGLYTYTTVGNSLRAVGPDSFDIHCDAPILDETGAIIGKQDHLVRGRSLSGDLQALDVGNGTTPGKLALRHECPECGAVECFNTALRSVDEGLSLPGWEQRMEQAYLIRQAQAQLGLPMLG